MPADAGTTLDIVCPVHNGGEPMGWTLRSLLASEDQDFRLLISENYSTDGVPWVRELEQFPPAQVVLVRPPEELGRVEHWTWAARQAEAEFCKVLLSGDRVAPNYIGTIRKAFAREPDLIYTPCIVLGRGNSFEEELSELQLRDAITPLTNAAYLARCKIKMNVIGPLSAVAFLTASLQAALPFEPTHPWIADWRLYTAIMRDGAGVSCGGSYCIVDRSIARPSSSFRGALDAIHEEHAYRRELAGERSATPLERFRETARPVTGLLLRRNLPRWLYRSLTGRSRRI